MDEFALIRKYFANQAIQREDVSVGIGDDAAVLTPAAGRNLVVTADMLLNGVHFPETTDPYAIGYKALAVSLSDLAAMGAEPAWSMLLLSLPVAEPAWIDEFAAGFMELAERHQVQLVGGDLVRGPMAVGVQVAGYVDPDGEIRRSGAHVGDGIYMSGCVGDAYLGLKVIQGELALPDDHRKQAVERLQYPRPRVQLGRAIAGLARSAIDISDGLYGDLGHIAASSEVACHIERDLVPVGSVYRHYLDQLGWEPALCSGDDYELCFTVPDGSDDELAAIADRLKVSVRRIGRVEDGSGVKVLHEGGELIPQHPGYNHFGA